METPNRYTADPDLVDDFKLVGRQAIKILNYIPKVVKSPVMPFRKLAILLAHTYLEGCLQHVTDDDLEGAMKDKDNLHQYTLRRGDYTVKVTLVATRTPQEQVH